MLQHLIGQLIAIILIGLNLHPALTSIGPLLEVIQQQTGLSNINVGLLTTLPVLLMGIGALLAIPIRQLRIGISIIPTLYTLTIVWGFISIICIILFIMVSILVNSAANSTNLICFKLLKLEI